MIQIGQKIDDFEFEVYQNQQIKKVKLSDYRGKWLALLFYPADFTFICPTELGRSRGILRRVQEGRRRDIERQHGYRFRPQGVA